MKRILLAISFMLLCCSAAWGTVPLSAYTVTYTCTGGFGPFGFTFPVYDATGFTVTVNGVLQPSTSYTTIPVNNNYNNGGSVTLNAPCTASNALVITRTTPVDQLINFYDNMPSLPTITGRSVDKLTMIAQELEGLLGTIGGGSVSITAVSPIVVTPSPILGLGVISCPTCSVGGSVTSVSGTAGQIDVANGTSTPVISLDASLVFPGSIAMGAHAADFGTASTFKMPVSAGATAGTAGYITYDTTAKSTHFQTNNNDSIPAAFASAPAGSKCLHTNGVTGLVTETAGDCASGGTGTVTSFSAGNLSPLFTTVVSTPTTTPALSFALSNFSGDAIYGNFTGSPAAPSTQSIPSCANDGVHALVYPSHTLTCESITASVTSVSGTADEITSTGGTTPVLALAAVQKWRPCTGIGLGDGVNAITAATYPMLGCVNNSGKTLTVTGIHCYTDNNGTSTLDVKNNGGTSLLTGVITCNNTKTSGGAAGTQSATVTIATTDALNFTFISDGTTKTTTWTVDANLP